MVIQDSEREEWATHPVTVEFVAKMREAREETMEAWANEAFVGSDGHTTLQTNAKALGGIDMLMQVIEIIESYRLDPQEILQ